MKKLTIIAFLIILILLSACGRRPGTRNDNNVVKQVPVLVEEVIPRNLNEYIQLTGKLEGWTDIVMTSETNGKIVELKKQLGDWVEKGEEIGRVDNLDYKIRFEQGQAAVLAAEASLETARMQMESSETLFEQDKISKVEYSQAKSNLKNAQAAYSGSQASLEQAQKAYDNSRFVAPVSGYIADLPIKVGEMLNSGMPICSIVDSKRLKIKTGVGETNIRKLSRGQKVFIKYRETGEEFTGFISGIGIRPLRNSAQYPVEIELDNPQNKLLPGMAVEARILSNVFKNVIYTSQNNILQEYEFYFVFTVNDDSLASRKKVDLGNRVGENVIITSGLDFGEKLVIEGVENLEEGTPVEIRKPLE